MTTFLTSDTHFGHRNIIRYCNRPFKDTEEMDEALIKNWNAKVRPNDTIYHLGDVGWYRDKKDKFAWVLSRLNGTKKLIIGNHDNDIDLLEKYFEVLGDLYKFREDGQHIILCHYPLRSWQHNMRGAWHLFGHCHATVPGYGKSFDVGVDAWSMQPLSFAEVKVKMDKLELKVPEPGFSCNQCRKFPCVCTDNDNAVKER